MQIPSNVQRPVLALIFFIVAGITLAQWRPPRPPQRVAPPGFMPPARPMIPGQLPGGAPLDPEKVRAEIKELEATQPHEVFARLNSVGLAVLTPQERESFARQAVERLATRVEVSNNRWATLTEVRTAVENAGGRDAVVVADLGVLAALAERRVLADAVFEVRHLAERGSWGEAVRRGQEWRQRLRELNTEADPQTLRTRTEVHEALASLLRAGQRRAALDALQQALRNGGLDGVPVDNLSPLLHDEVAGLRGLETVRRLADEARLSAVEIATLKEGVQSFTKSFRALPDADESLGARILQELAIRHLLQGHTTEYRALMPADAPADQAARLLRDMKALALGEGEVVTAAARQALPADAARTGEPPPGIRAIMPESARKDWHPPKKGEAKASSAALEKAVRAGEILKAQIETNARKERIQLEGEAKDARQSMETAQRRVRGLEEADIKRLAEVADALGRPLEIVDKMIVRRLASQQQTNRQIVAELKKQPRPPADAKVPR
jgi:hypothetical protein